VGFCGTCGKDFSGFWFFLLPSRVHARPHAGDANRWADTEHSSALALLPHFFILRSLAMTTTVAIIGAVGWLVLTFGAAALGARFLPDEWYRQLNKPTWNPPNSIFAPVWTVLYLLMAVAAWLVWRRYGINGALLPLTLFIVQLLLNAAWTWLFFGLHRIRDALIDIIVLWLVILTTLISFWRLEPLAGILLVPYLAWVSFATVLTMTIWRLNR
jgi:translocator protein